MKNNLLQANDQMRGNCLWKVLEGEHSIEILEGSVDMSNLDQQWMPLILCRDIIHPGFPQEVKVTASRTNPIEGPPKKNIHK